MRHRAHEGNNGSGDAQHRDPRITLERYRGEVKILLDGVPLASSSHALVMRESGYAPVYYFPRGDVQMALLMRTGHSTYCPHKGQASYWTIKSGEKVMENAAWSYESPYDAVLAIKGCIAFHGHGLDIQHVEAR